MRYTLFIVSVLTTTCINTTYGFYIIKDKDSNNDTLIEEELKPPITKDFFHNTISSTQLPTLLIRKKFQQNDAKTLADSTVGTPSVNRIDDAKIYRFNNTIPQILKIISNGNRLAESKQLFGGKLPPFIEGIIKRIQNYFSVYNPPIYFDNNHPPLIIENDVVCSENDTCSEIIESNASTIDFENAFNECEENITNNSLVENSENSECDENYENCEEGPLLTIETNITSYSEQTYASVSTSDDYKINKVGTILSQTITYDNNINTYTQAPYLSGNDQLLNNIIILEPTPFEYTPGSDDTIKNPRPNTFLVYSSFQSTQNQIESMKSDIQNDIPKTKTSDALTPNSSENVTYFVIAYKDTINTRTSGEVAEEEKCSDGCNNHGEQKCICSQVNENEKQIKQIISNGSYSVPNINLVLIPIEMYNKNRMCFKRKPQGNQSNSTDHYYVLRPEASNFLSTLNITKTGNKRDDKIAHNLSFEYLPPQKESANFIENIPVTSSTQQITVPENNKYPILSKFPMLYRILMRRQEEPRVN